MSNRYRVTHVAHYIGGRLVHPDRGDESIVTLPAGIEPGRWLQPLDATSVATTVNREAAKAFEAKHIAGGRYAVIQISDGTRASRLFTAEDGDAKAAAQAEAQRLNEGGQIDLGTLPADGGDGAGDSLPDA